MLTIGTVAREAGVSAQTLRYYEREGLLDPPPRTPSGYRAYDRSVIGHVSFIRRAQQLGFTLKEVRELIELQTDGIADCDEVRNAVTAKLDDIERKIDELAHIRAALTGLVETCTGDRPACRCVIIDNMKLAPGTSPS
jgi:MerR family transcriptional regulator, copper efflux regulator